MPALSPERPCAPQLLAKVDDASMYSGVYHVVTAEEASALRTALAGLERSVQPAAPERIEIMVGKLSIAFPRQNLSDAEAEVRLEQYVMGLDDIPPDLLEQAYRQAIKTRTFFPTVAELRALCTGFAMRHWRIARVRSLLATYERHEASGRPHPDSLPARPDVPDTGERRGSTSIGNATQRIIDAARAGAGNTTTTKGRN
jgi:hypothetical protein